MTPRYALKVKATMLTDSFAGRVYGNMFEYDKKRK